MSAIQNLHSFGEPREGPRGEGRVGRLGPETGPGNLPSALGLCKSMRREDVWPRGQWGQGLGLGVGP